MKRVRPGQVFATCGSERKRRYLLDTFPGLREDHIGDSRSTSFEAMIKHMVRRRCPAPAPRQLPACEPDVRRRCMSTLAQLLAHDAPALHT